MNKFWYLIIAFALLYVGGWDIVWGDYVSYKSLVYDENTLAIVFNNKVYGIEFYNRFFYSPIISWILLGASIASFGSLFKGGDELEEGESKQQEENNDK